MVPCSLGNPQSGVIIRVVREPLVRTQSPATDGGMRTTSSLRRTNRTAIVLAGGRSSRFGSNKALQVLAGKPLISHVAERLSNVADEALVVIGRGESSAEYRAILPSSVKVINDESDVKNPLVGIMAGLHAAKTDYAAILACDIPFVNEAVIELLFRCAVNADAAIPRWNGGRIEPLEAVYRRFSTLHAAQEALTQEDPSQREMINRLARVVYVSVEDEVRSTDPTLRTFFNVNTREDITVAERIIAETNLSGRDAGLSAKD